MNKQMLVPMWDMMRQRMGIVLRAIEAMPADKIDAHPIPGMRTPKELVVHQCGFLRLVPEAVVKGSIASPDEKALAASITSKDQLLAFARECWAAADKTTATVTDAQLGAMVETPWGSPFPGFVMYAIAQEEFIHHRGQLFSYLRVYGIEPPMMWSFEANAAEYQPKAHSAS